MQPQRSLVSTTLAIPVAEQQRPADRAGLSQDAEAVMSSAGPAFCPAHCDRGPWPRHKGSPCRKGEAEVFPTERTDARLMAVFRLIGAAYETGDAACWEAAHVHAEETLDAQEAALLVARATALVRIIRIDRPDFGFLPLPCRRLSGDEALLLRLLRAASGETATLRVAAQILDNAGGIRLLASAARTLADPASAGEAASGPALRHTAIVPATVCPLSFKAF